MKRFLLLLSILMLCITALTATPDESSVKSIMEPATGDSVVTEVRYTVGDSSTDWFAVAFTDRANSSLTGDFSDIAVSEIPLSLDGKIAVNTTDVFVSWSLITHSNVRVLLSNRGSMSTTVYTSTIPFTITAENVSSIPKDSEGAWLVLCDYKGAESAVYGTAGSKQIQIATDEIISAGNGNYRSMITVFVESAS